MYVIYYYLDTSNTYFPNAAMISVGNGESPFKLHAGESQWIIPGTVDPNED